jgi:hypothetical protein
MLKIIFRFVILVFLNYSVINLSDDIDLEQLVKDFELLNISISKDAILLDFFVSILITILTLSLIFFFKPFIEIYLLYYLKYTFYLLVNLLSLSTIFIVLRIYGYSRLYLLFYLIISSSILILSDKIKR